MILDIHGYTKLDAFWDNQQMIGFRSDHLVVSPEPTRHIGAENNHPNERGQFHYTAIESRLGMTVTDPCWSECTQAEGQIETDFFGVAEASVATARLRHAYGTITYKDTISVLFGQTWHPLFITSCHPRTLGFDYAAPTEPQSRAPQARFTITHNDVHYICTLLSQQEPFVSDGPNGPSTEYIRQSMMPEFNWRIDIPYDDNLVGASLGVKRLVPRIATDTGEPTDASVTSAVIEAYAKWNMEPISICAKAFYAQNTTESVVLNGYGITQRDIATDRQSYDTIDAGGGWIDIECVLNENWHMGTVFAGVAKDNDTRFLGATANEDAIEHRFGLIPRARSVFRASPRVYWEYNNITSGLEVAIMHTTFGSIDERSGRIVDAFSETGVRTLFVSYYYF